MTLYTTNNLNNTTAMLFNGVGNQYYNYNLGGCGCGGFNIGNWLNGAFNNYMSGYNYGCGCGTGNAGLGYAIFSGLLNGLMVCGAGMITGSRANKAAKATEEKTLRQDFKNALETIGLNGRSDAQLADMNDAAIDSAVETSRNALVEEISGYDTEIKDLNSQITKQTDTVKSFKENYDNALSDYNKAKNRTEPKATAEELKKLLDDAEAKKALWIHEKETLEELQGKDGKGGKLAEAKSNYKKAQEKLTKFDNAVALVKNYITKTLKPAQTAEAQSKKGEKPGSKNLNGNGGAEGVNGNGQIQPNPVNTPSKEAVINAAKAYENEMTEDNLNAFISAYYNYRQGGKQNTPASINDDAFKRVMDMDGVKTAYLDYVKKVDLE